MISRPQTECLRLTQTHRQSHTFVRGRLLSAAIFSLLISTVNISLADSPAELQLTEIKVLPEKIQLAGSNRRQQLLVTAITTNGKKIDVTRRCEMSVDDPLIVSLEKGVVRGQLDGKTNITIHFGSLVKQVPVEVSEFDVFPAVHFSNDVVPVFSKLGCNSGGCHGKQSGQNGFKLSVFGFDPQADYDALVKESRGRRIFPADPSRSLLLLKATGILPHGGGMRAEPHSADAELLENWVRQGMPWGDLKSVRPVSLTVEPTLSIMEMNADQQILVTANYSDGSRRDVTSAASYSGNADLVAVAEKHGLIHTGNRPGEAAVTINYMGHVAAVRVLVPRDDAPHPYPLLEAVNPIDEFVWSKLEKMGIVPSAQAGDATFLRRLYLDTIGTLPSIEEVRKFLDDPNPSKRQKAIEHVLGRDEFTDYWALKWADILLVDQEKLGERGAYQFHRWLREQIAQNRPYDQWVRELITATGNSGKNGPVNFYRAMRTPEDLTKTISQAFLGVRMDCAQCHHHPFEIWSQEDFYGMAGFFQGIQRKTLPGNRELVYHAGYRETKLPLTGEPITTRPPGGNSPESLDEGDPRVYLARWITARENPWFAKLVANRLWKHFLGRGLVEPEDDLRSTNPATNEPLLSYLSQQVVENQYDLKAVMRLILSSRVYQLSSETNETNFQDEQNFSHHLIKRLPAESLLDAISHVTGSPEKFSGMPRGTKAVQLWDNRMPSYFLETFGRSERKSPCECAKSNEPTMAQALHLMNAPEIEAKIVDPQGRIAKLMHQDLKPSEIVNQLCLAVLGRGPLEKEKRIAANLFSQQPKKKAAEDFLWILLNSYDFLFVH